MIKHIRRFLRYLAGAGSATYLPSGVINVNTTNAGTAADLVKTTLISYTLPANSLNANGKAVRVKAYGVFAGNANSKSAGIDFGGTELISKTSVYNNLSWSIEALVIRNGTNSQEYIAELDVDGQSAGRRRGTAAITDTANIAIDIWGQNGVASASDIVAEGMIVEYLG